jgi:pimeloyl-ACP methyl ester carboxylesterase
VLESGAGDFAATLGWIAPVVAKDTRVCVYDRAGRGWSEPANSPQDATQIAADLRTVLHEADVPGPYVLAGHSFGGLYVLTYAANYPDDVAGMVLVDSTAPKAPTGEVTASSDLTNRATALLSSSARLGLWRLINESAYDSLPPQSRDEAKARGSNAGTVRSTLDEYVQGNASMSEAGALTDLADKPLFVLTAGKGSGAGWPAKQDRLARLSSNSAHRVVDGAEHASFIYEKKYAAETTQAILEVVSAVRHSGPVH